MLLTEINTNNRSTDMGFSMVDDKVGWKMADKLKMSINNICSHLINLLKPFKCIFEQISILISIFV